MPGRPVASPESSPGSAAPWALAGYAGGVFLASHPAPMLLGLAVPIALAVALRILARAGARSRLERWPRARPTVLAIFFVLGGMRVLVPRGETASSTRDASDGPILVRALVLDVPAPRQRGRRAYLETPIRLLDGRLATLRTETLPAGEHREWRAGEWIEVRARRPGVRDDSSRAATFPPRFEAASIDAIRGIEVPRTASLLETLLAHRGAIRERAHELLASLYDAPARGLLAALVLGDRRWIDPDLRGDFERTGALHFLAVSGLHVGIVLLLVLRAPLPRGVRTLARLAFLAGFCALTGAQAPVLRAASMLGAQLVLRRAGRHPEPFELLSWAATGVLVVDPGELTRVGFLLSFTAVAAILTWARVLDDRRERRELELLRPRPAPGKSRLPDARDRLHSALCVSFATNAATAPIIASAFQRVHPLAPLVSVLVCPLACALLMLGSASLLVGSVALPLAVPFAAVAKGLVALLAATLERASALELACLWVPSPPPWRMVIAFVALVAGLRSHAWRRAAFVLTLAAALATLVMETRTPRSTRLVHLDVGGASAAVLVTQRAGVWLIDAGSNAPPARHDLVRRLLRLGVTGIEGVLLTHADHDHVAELESVARELGTRRLVVPEIFANRSAGRRVLDMARRHGAEIRVVARGDRIRLGEVTLDVLFPPAAHAPDPSRRSNDLSLAVAIESAGARVLVLGDLEEDGLGRLLQAPAGLRADALVLPHHGRRTPLLPGLLDAVTPELVVASGDGRGGAVEALETAESRGIRAFATWRGGDIEQIFVEGLVVTAYLSSAPDRVR